MEKTGMRKTIDCYIEVRKKWQEGVYCLDELIEAMEKNDVSLIIRQMKKVAETLEQTRVLVKQASYMLNMELKWKGGG